MRGQESPQKEQEQHVLGQFAAGWLGGCEVAIDEGGGPWNAMCERMPCGCSVQRSITRAEMLALCKAICKIKGPGGLVRIVWKRCKPTRKYKMSSRGPKRK